MRARTAILTATLLTAGCMTTGLSSGVEVEAVDRSYQMSTAAWDGGGYMVFLTKAMEHEGKLRLCGAYGAANLAPGARERAYERDVAETVSLTLGGVRVATGLDFMARYDDAYSPLDQPANCRVTRTDWRPEFQTSQTRIFLGRTVF